MTGPGSPAVIPNTGIRRAETGATPARIPAGDPR